MVVKSATKKKLMDLGIAEEFSHKLADDRKWDDVKVLTSGQIAQICGIDSGTAQEIYTVMEASAKPSRAAAATEKTIVRRRAVSRRRKKKALPMQEYDSEAKMRQILRNVDIDDENYQQLQELSIEMNIDMTPRILNAASTKGRTNRPQPRSGIRIDGESRARVFIQFSLIDVAWFSWLSNQ